jgi:hypothetical protein
VPNDTKHPRNTWEKVFKEYLGKQNIHVTVEKE